MKDKILIFFTIFLIFLFPLSFLIEKKQNFIKTYETSFLNPENDKEIEKIIGHSFTIIEEEVSEDE